MRTPCLQSGSVLLEGLIAILLFSVGVIALLGLQARSINDATQSNLRMEASFLANEIISDMWADGPTQATSYVWPGGTSQTMKAWVGKVAQLLPGSGTYPPTITVNDVTNDTGARYEITVTLQWLPPKETVPHKYVGSAYINRNG